MRLALELVPESCWHSNVRSHVRAATWDRISREVSAAHGFKCQICNGVGVAHALECHELWHYDDDRHIQRLDGLMALCPACHMVKHMGRAVANGKGAAALTWFAHVNELTPAAALLAVREAFAIQQARSRHAWQLNIQLLSTRYHVKLNLAGQEL